MSCYSILVSSKDSAKILTLLSGTSIIGINNLNEDWTIIKIDSTCYDILNLNLPCIKSIKVLYE